MNGGGEGSPREPVPGTGRTECKSRIGVRQGEDARELEQASVRELMSRSIYIINVDVDNNTITPGCKGCIAVSAGKKTVMHSEGCRSRMEEIIREKEPERSNAALEGMMEWMSKGAG